MYYDHRAQIDFDCFITQRLLLACMAVVIGIQPCGSPTLDLPSQSLVTYSAMTLWNAPAPPFPDIALLYAYKYISIEPSVEFTANRSESPSAPIAVSNSIRTSMSVRSLAQLGVGNVLMISISILREQNLLDNVCTAIFTP